MAKFSSLSKLLAAIDSGWKSPPLEPEEDWRRRLEILKALGQKLTSEQDPEMQLRLRHTITNFPLTDARHQTSIWSALKNTGL